MMMKFIAWFLVLSCTTALSCRKLEGFPLLKSSDSNLSGSAVQGHHAHVLKRAGLNRTVSSEKVENKDQYYKQHHEIVQSEKSKGGGKGTYGGANVPHHSNKKNAAPTPLLNPPCFLSTVGLHVIFTHFQL